LLSREGGVGTVQAAVVWGIVGFWSRQGVVPVGLVSGLLLLDLVPEPREGDGYAGKGGV
jgi:hypothetical protein